MSNKVVQYSKLGLIFSEARVCQDELNQADVIISIATQNVMEKVKSLFLENLMKLFCFRAGKETPYVLFTWKPKVYR